MKKPSRRAFAQAFIALLREKEFDDIQTVEIIRASGYAKSSFYRNFQTKYDLLNQLVETEAEIFGTSLALNTAEDGTADKNHLYKTALDTMKHVKENYRLYHMIFSNMFPDAGLSQFSEYAVHAFSASRVFTHVEKDASLDLELYYYCETHHIIRIIAYWDAHGFEETPEFMASQIVSMKNLVI